GRYSRRLHTHVRPLLQLVHAVGDDQVAGRKSLVYGDHVALGCAHGHAAHLDGLVRLDDIYKRTLLAALETGRRDQNRIVDGADEQLRVDELIWKQHVVLIGKGRLELDRAGGLIDLVVGSEQLSSRELVLEVTIVSLDRQLGVSLHRGLEAWQIVLGNTEINRDRLQLRDHRQTGRVGRMNYISHVHQTQPDPARDRRRDVAVGQLKLGVVHGALIALNRTCILSDRRFLVVEILTREGILLEQFLVARECNLGVFERRHILRERALDLLELHLVRTRIDLGQQIAGLYHLSLFEVYLIELAIHPAFDGDRVVCRHCSDRGYVLVQIADLRRHRRHRNDRVRYAWRRLCGRIRAAAANKKVKANYRDGQNDQPQPPSLHSFVEPSAHFSFLYKSRGVRFSGRGGV